ncbi:MAG: N-acetylmuramoyl-L-alanine amidase AmiC [Calditrichaeota bacterium]|nr:N-acetylmuramoyl-L-alanine amidase AmiC [Calditrichota bacterium]
MQATAGLLRGAGLLLTIISGILLSGCAAWRGLSPREEGLDRIAGTWREPPAAADTSAGALTVIYPRGPAPDTALAPGDSVIAGIPPDSLFLLGHVADPTGALEINGVSVPIHPGGGWLAWVARGPVEERALAGDSARVRTSAVTIRYRGASHGQELRAARRIVFADTIPHAEPAAPPGFVTNRTRLAVIDPDAKLRCGWPGTYDMFPPAGTLLYATGVDSGARVVWKVPLGDGEIGWIEDRYVRVLDDDTPPPVQVIDRVIGEVDRRETRVRIPLAHRAPFRVARPADDRLELTVYGAVSWTDLIVQPHGSRVVDELRWSQVDSTTWRLTAFVNAGWFQGWSAEFDDRGWLVWTIHAAPEIRRRSLSGVRVVVDPGHGGADYSAIGPTGLPEKTANLRLAEAVAAELEDAGATVIPTRTADTTLALADRVAFARAQRADILLSLHHNALAQGVRPFARHGASVHYYHRHAKPLAAALYEAITGAGWPGDGLRYQDLALARPSFCPAVLVEAAFIMHPGEEALLRRESFRRDVARWIREGVEEYVRRMRAVQRERDE